MSAQKTPRPELDFVPADFFAFRTPLLPFEEIERFSAGLAYPKAGDDPAAREAALAADKALLRQRLAALLERPEVQEALFIASPSLTDALEHWHKDPESKKGRRAERAVVRYFLRMASRATPFGLFSGCSLGQIDPSPEAPTRLTVVARPSYERHTRLDMDYLFALCEDLSKEPAFQAEFQLRPNSSLYRAAGRLRYAEARMENKVRSHHLVAVEATDYLEATLERAKGGAKAADLARALVESDPDGEITIEDANEFLRELIDSQVLVADLTPPVTGPEAIHDLVAQLAALPPGQEAGKRLAAARDVLAELDAGGPGAPTERYRGIAESLGELETEVEMSRLFQLDMVKPGLPEAPPVLGGSVVAEIERALELLYRLGGRARHEGLERFVKDFNERYEGREIPLLEALDEEIGIGFERSQGAGAEASPLLRGMALGGPASDPTVPWGPRQGFLLHRLHEALAAGARVIDLTDDDWAKLAPESPDGAGDKAPLPDAFQVMATLSAPSEEAFLSGDFQVLFEGAGGPSGARLLGRFCHADPALTRGVEEHLRAEEAQRPDAVFAEIVHLPQGRIGNILSRPVLRDHEIAFLGRSGAPEERQIAVSDLRVSVAGPRIVLRSARLGKEVIPRLTSAHNFSMRSLGVYRFLCTLQTQGIQGGLGWSWGPLDGAPFLPRVTSGRLVLSRASWWLSAEEIKTLKEAKGDDRFEAARKLRQKRGLPRLVTLGDGDNELLVDWDNALSVDTLIDVVEDRDRARLFEFFPSEEELFARGPEGRFVHEVVIPFVRRPKEATARPGRRPAATVGGLTVERSFPPGSEWLYAKLYTGTSTADGLLLEAISPVVREALGSGAADGWFFIRYADPEWHLRVRFHGDPEALSAQVLPALEKATSPLLAAGKLWRMQLDTYEREIERYGGPLGIGVSEKYFQIDSEAVLSIVEMLEGDEGADARWRLAVVGSDRLLTDLGIEGEQRMAVLQSMKDSFNREFGGGKGLRVQIDQRFRTEKRSLEALLDPVRAAESPLAPGIAVIDERSRRLAPVAAELRRLEAAGQLTVPVHDLAPSYIHMHNNRLIRSAGRAHELLIYDFLHSLHQSRAARERAPKDRPAKEKGEKKAQAPEAAAV